MFSKRTPNKPRYFSSPLIHRGLLLCHFALLEGRTGYLSLLIMTMATSIESFNALTGDRGGLRGPNSENKDKSEKQE